MSFNYEVIYAKRKTLTISVERDRKIVVRAPQGLSAQKIDELITKKHNWIIEN